MLHYVGIYLGYSPKGTQCFPLIRRPGFSSHFGGEKSPEVCRGLDIVEPKISLTHSMSMFSSFCICERWVMNFNQFYIFNLDFLPTSRINFSIYLCTNAQSSVTSPRCQVPMSLDALRCGFAAKSSTLIPQVLLLADEGRQCLIAYDQRQPVNSGMSTCSFV